MTAHQAMIYATLDDVHRRFVAGVPSSARRQVIWDGWMQHRAAFEATGLMYSTLVNGSFCTSKENPGDIDLGYLLDAQELQRLDGTQRAQLAPLFDVAHCKSTFQCHPSVISVFPMTHLRFQLTIQSISYWTRVFGTDRFGRGKAIVLVGQRGTL